MALFNHPGVWVACSTDITTDEISAKKFVLVTETRR